MISGDKTPMTSDFVRADYIKIEVTATPLYVCVQENTMSCVTSPLTVKVASAEFLRENRIKQTNKQTTNKYPTFNNLRIKILICLQSRAHHKYFFAFQDFRNTVKKVCTILFWRASRALPVTLETKLLIVN